MSSRNPNIKFTTDLKSSASLPSLDTKFTKKTDATTWKPTYIDIYVRTWHFAPPSYTQDYSLIKTFFFVIAQRISHAGSLQAKIPSLKLVLPRNG